jgi:WhiB family redox-sensing transcriptional regulator
MIEPPPAWMDDALCATYGYSELWFPTQQSSTAAQAKAICRQCPVRTQCLEYALDRHRRGIIEAGVWGGTTEHERKDFMVGRTRICPDCGVATGPPVRGRNPRCGDCLKERRAETYRAYNERRKGAA